MDAKTKIHAFIHGLRSRPFFDSLIVNGPVDFGDLLKRITPYIHLEEAEVAASKEDVEKGGGKGEMRPDKEEGRDTRQGFETTHTRGGPDMAIVLENIMGILREKGCHRL